MVIDAGFNQQVERMLLDDFARSKPMDPTGVTRMSRRFQLKSPVAGRNICRLQSFPGFDNQTA
ncbi:MAG TPA: hypothetical protein PKE55_13035 [Kiritimatiellia bacterium]|nr:hypothetical protein [Kiritimatiellia bacterium]